MKESKEILFQNESTHPIGRSKESDRPLRFLKDKQVTITVDGRMVVIPPNDELCRLLEDFAESQTKQLREENESYKEMNQALRDQVKQFEKTPNLFETCKANTELGLRIQELEEGIRRGYETLEAMPNHRRTTKEMAEFFKSLLTKDTKNN